MSLEGTGEAINQLYMGSVRKYELLKDEFDSLGKRYSDLVTTHTKDMANLEKAQVCLLNNQVFSHSTQK